MAHELNLESPLLSGGILELGGHLSCNPSRLRLAWRIPAEQEPAVTDHADPFVIGLLFPMMQIGGEFVIKGKVSPSLLRNLQLFTAIWQLWIPQKYRPVYLRGQEEIELPAQRYGRQAVVPFSGGIDSCYTVFRHTRNLMSRRNQQLKAAIVIEGFDVDPAIDNAKLIFAGLLKNAQGLLASIGVPCIRVSSNFRDLPITWTDAFNTHLVSGLSLFSKKFATALIPNNLPYNSIHPWGSTPVTDPLLGSDGFGVLDDGGEKSRFDKVCLLKEWPELLHNLRVCYSNPDSCANCCVCEKCIRTILAFRIAGVALPPAFPHDVSLRQIRGVRFRHPMHRQMWVELLSQIKPMKLEQAAWAKAMLIAARHRPLWPKIKKTFVPLRNQIRKRFRGSPLSKREVANLLPSLKSES